VKEATDLYRRAADMALARGLPGTASGYAAHQALTEALYSRDAAAPDRIRQVLQKARNDADAPGTAPRFRATVALGLAGLTTDAQALAAEAEHRYPESTFTRTVLVPATRAAIALRGSRAEAAIEALRAAAPAETGTVAGLLPLYLRGQAYMIKGWHTEAIREFERLLAFRGVDPLSPLVPLAHLQIGRAKAMAGDAAGARAAYETVLETWASADPDFAPLQEARQEYDRIRRPLTGP
jgi:hypothetical protein